MVVIALDPSTSNPHWVLFPLGPSRLRLDVVIAGEEYDLEFSYVTLSDTPTDAPSSEEKETLPDIVLLTLLSVVSMPSVVRGWESRFCTLMVLKLVTMLLPT